MMSELFPVSRELFKALNLMSHIRILNTFKANRIVVVIYSNRSSEERSLRCRRETVYERKKS